LEGFLPIWADLTESLPNAGEPVNMATFFDGFTPALQGDLQAIAQERSMGFVVDLLSSAMTVNGSSQHATLFPGIGFTDPADRSTTFQGVKDELYTIRTLGLTNGGDTTVEIQDSTGKSLAFSDNATAGTGYAETDYSTCDSGTPAPACPTNDGESLAAAVTGFKPAADETFTIIVRRSPLAPPSAGRYGGFDLLVTSP
jgi:hypothetical protein